MATDNADAHIVYDVPGRSRARIRAAAVFMRTFSGATEPYLPILDLLEFGFGPPNFKYHITLDIREPYDMAGDHARSIPGQRIIMVRGDVYQGAYEGNGRDRFTLAHELGHVLLHPDTGLARRVLRADIPPYRSSEWQADCFAGELLMPIAHIHQCASINQAMKDFGVSREAARYQINKVYKKEGLISTELPDE